jgi:ribosomal protein L12E/L44/L45/RPP1/RPP2
MLIGSSIEDVLATASTDAAAAAAASSARMFRGARKRELEEEYESLRRGE